MHISQYITKLTSSNVENIWLQSVRNNIRNNFIVNFWFYFIIAPVQTSPKSKFPKRRVRNNSQNKCVSLTIEWLSEDDIKLE